MKKSKQEAVIDPEKIKESIRKVNSITKKLQKEFDSCKFDGKRADIQKKMGTCSIRLSQLKDLLKKANSNG